MTQRGWIIIVALLWALLSWRWYTCHIKGFCGSGSSSQAVHVGTERDGEQYGEGIDLDHDGDIDVIVRSLDAGDGTMIYGERCAPYITGYLLPAPEDAGNSPRDARNLAAFLNATQGTELPVDGTYDDADVAAVHAFQEAHADAVLTPWGITASTGRVMQTTRAHINRLHCREAQG